MAVTSTLVKQVDLPVWEWMKFAPVASTDYSAMCSDGKNQRYLYYMVNFLMYRYDTVTDGWQQLAPSSANGVSTQYTGGIQMKYSDSDGYRGNVLGATTNTLTIPGFKGNMLNGYKIRIHSGTGMGQEKTILSNSDITVMDGGIASNVLTSNAGVVDATKRWKTNQWIGYQLRLTFSSGANMIRKIIYNDTTSLYVYDINYWYTENWNNIAEYATAPMAIPASNVTHYTIEKSTITVDTNWTVQPDETSCFTILSGGIWVVVSTQATNYLLLHFYDVLTDTWMYKTAPPQTAFTATYMTAEMLLECIDDSTGAFETGTISAATSKTVTTNLSLTGGRYANYQIRITGGTGKGQHRRIIGNDNGATAKIYVNSVWDITPDNTSTFSIYNDYQLLLMGSLKSTTLKYLIDEDMWVTGSEYESGIARIGTLTKLNKESIAFNTATRQTTSIISLSATPTVTGTGYAVGDIFSITGGTALAYGRVETITAGGVVATVSLYSNGNGYTTGTGKATANILGTGTSLTVNILSVGLTARVTTALNHNMKIGDSVVLKGAVEGAWNTTYTITGTFSLTIIEFVTTATADFTTATALSTTIIVDVNKNWTINELVGKIVHLYTTPSYVAPVYQSRRITSNTATTITVPTITAAVNGTSKYAISSPMAFGRDTQQRVTDKQSFGFATGGTSGTLVDSTKNWLINQWAGYKMRIICGTGFDNTVGDISITANDATTLTITTPGFTADATTQYQIMDTFGLCTSGSTATTINDTTKNWATNQWIGKSVRLMGGPGAAANYYDINITANTATQLTLGATLGQDTNATYCILANNVRAAGSGLEWLHGGTITADIGRYLIAPKGAGTGSNSWDKYDLVSELWELAIPHFPNFGEQLVNGSMFAFDKKDTIYFQVGITGRIIAYNMYKGIFNVCAQIPYGMGAACTGNRLEIVQTADGLKYLYLIRHTGAEMWRTLLFWD